MDAARIRPAFNWLPETGLFRQFQYLTVPLRLTAESYPHIAAAIQRAFGDVVPPLAPGTCDGD